MELSSGPAAGERPDPTQQRQNAEASGSGAAQALPQDEQEQWFIRATFPEIRARCQKGKQYYNAVVGLRDHLRPGDKDKPLSFTISKSGGTRKPQFYISLLLSGGRRIASEHLPVGWKAIRSRDEFLQPTDYSTQEVTWLEHGGALFSLENPIRVNMWEKVYMETSSREVYSATFGVIAYVQSGPKNDRVPYETRYLLTCTHFTHDLNGDQMSIESELLGNRGAPLCIKSDNILVPISDEAFHLSRDSGRKDCAAVRLTQWGDFRPVKMLEMLNRFQTAHLDLLKKSDRKEIAEALASVKIISTDFFSWDFINEENGVRDQIAGDNRTKHHYVLKYGCKTGLTLGVIDGFKYTAKRAGLHWIIKDLQGFRRFSEEGDSGACVFLLWEQRLRALGVLTEGSTSRGTTTAYDVSEGMKDLLNQVGQHHWRHAPYLHSSEPQERPQVFLATEYMVK